MLFLIKRIRSSFNNECSSWCKNLDSSTNTRPQRLFSSPFGGRQSVTMVFTRWPREDSFPVSGALGGTCRCLSRFCNILLQDLTLLHVKISRSTNFLSVCRRKLKLLTHLHTVSYNHIRFLNTCSRLVRISWAFVGGNSNCWLIYTL